MAITIDYVAAQAILEKAFEKATIKTRETFGMFADLNEAFDVIFGSRVRSYREVLLGCALARVVNASINIRHPYSQQSEDAFSGRTLDERVINPFLVAKQIPCSKGPYLAVFRRNVRLDASSRDGLRDKVGYDAMLKLLDSLEASAPKQADIFLQRLLLAFLELREKSDIRLVSIARLSLEQYKGLFTRLLHCKSGGLMPMLLTAALFQTISKHYQRGWKISRQGINEADNATGAAGDITITTAEGKLLKAIEVTERPISQTRVTTTFNTKMITGAAREYLFIYTNAKPEIEAYTTAQTYFAQGYDIQFAQLDELIVATFLVGDAAMRTCFMREMLTLLGHAEIPATTKTAWNDALQSLVSTAST